MKYRIPAEIKLYEVGRMPLQSKHYNIPINKYSLTDVKLL